MPFSHGLAAKFTLTAGATDLSPYLTEIDPSFERKMVELVHLGSTWTDQLAGVRAFKLSAKGDFDPTLDAAIYAAWNGDVAVAWTYTPQVAGPVYSGNCRIPSYKPGPATATGAVGYSYELVNDGTISRA